MTLNKISKKILIYAITYLFFSIFVTFSILKLKIDLYFTTWIEVNNYNNILLINQNQIFYIYKVKKVMIKSHNQTGIFTIEKITFDFDKKIYYLIGKTSMTLIPHSIVEVNVIYSQIRLWDFLLNQTN